MRQGRQDGSKATPFLQLLIWGYSFAPAAALRMCSYLHCTLAKIRRHQFLAYSCISWVHVRVPRSPSRPQMSIFSSELHLLP